MEKIGVRARIKGRVRVCVGVGGRCNLGRSLASFLGSQRGFFESLFLRVSVA